MAGDWIKVERATLHKPEIMEAAEMLGIKRREALGLFLEYFAWLDENMPDSCYGIVTHVSRLSVDESLHEPGFAVMLERIGWAKFDDLKRTLTITNYDRHNGKTAKTRALSQKRMQKMRADPLRNRYDSVTPNAYPEKRREEVIPKGLTPPKPNGPVDNSEAEAQNHWWRSIESIAAEAEKYGIPTHGKTRDELYQRIKALKDKGASMR